MDGSRFDDLTRTLATGGNRRSLLRRGVLGGMALLGLGKSGVLAAPGKTTICHQTDTGYNLITVADSALPAHYGHGDVAYMDCCTDSECAADAYCNAGTCTPLCVNEDCPDEEVCQNGACAPLECAPPLVPIDHACQQPLCVIDDECPEGYSCKDGGCAICLAPSDPCGAPNTACCVESETGSAVCSTEANSSEAGEARCCLTPQSYCWRVSDCCDGYDCVYPDGAVCDSGDPNVCTGFCCTHEVGATCGSPGLDCCYPLVCVDDETGTGICQNPI
jgi:hypothetical protein